MAMLTKVCKFLHNTPTTTAIGHGHTGALNNGEK